MLCFLRPELVVYQWPDGVLWSVLFPGVLRFVSDGKRCPAGSQIALLEEKIVLVNHSIFTNGLSTRYRECCFPTHFDSQEPGVTDRSKSRFRGNCTLLLWKMNSWLTVISWESLGTRVNQNRRKFARKMFHEKVWKIIVVIFAEKWINFKACK